MRQAVADAKRHGRVRLVGHSYGGQVISGAGHDADELVYVAAMVTSEGESAFESLGEALSGIPGMVFDHGQISFTRDALPAFYARCDRSTRESAFSQLRPIGISCVTGALSVSPAWRLLPSAYVVCTFDVVLPQSYQRSRAALLSRSVEIEADHSPFASAPGELTTAIVAPGYGADAGGAKS